MSNEFGGYENLDDLYQHYHEDPYEAVNDAVESLRREEILRELAKRWVRSGNKSLIESGLQVLKIVDPTKYEQERKRIYERQG